MASSEPSSITSTSAVGKRAEDVGHHRPHAAGLVVGRNQDQQRLLAGGADPFSLAAAAAALGSDASCSTAVPVPGSVARSSASPALTAVVPLVFLHGVLLADDHVLLAHWRSSSLTTDAGQG